MYYAGDGREDREDKGGKMYCADGGRRECRGGKCGEIILARDGGREVGKERWENVFGEAGGEGNEV